jgi:hypothetical protein
MDNYFTSVPLFKMLRERGYGACGTTRPRGLPLLLQELRNDHSKSLPWGTICAIPMNDVLCLAWQDNNLVLGLSTIHSASTLVSRDRKRPGKTSTNASIVYKVFKDKPRRELDIPAFINDYNHYMNGVDLANQYRSAYETHRSTRRNWLPILYWLLDASIINAYRIQYIYKLQHNGKPISQLDFREGLYQELFNLQEDDLPVIRLNSRLNYQRIQLSKQAVCIWCSYIRKKGQKDSKRASRSRSGCLACNVALCLKAQCWEEYHRN